MPWLLISGATSVAGLLAGLRLFLNYRAKGRGISLPDALASGLMEWWLWIPLVPLGLALARRFEPFATGANAWKTARAVGVHMLAAGAIACLHLLLFTSASAAFRMLRFDAAWRLDLASPFLALFIPDLFTYGLLISLGWWRFNRQRLRQAANLVDEKSPPRTAVLFQAGRGSLSIYPDEIDFVSAAGNYLELHVGAKTHLVRDTLKNVHGRLGLERFARIHRSTLVRLDAVIGVEDGAQPALLIEGGLRLPIGASYQSAIGERLAGQRPIQGSAPP